VEVLVLQVFVSLMLVTGSILLFWFTCHKRDFDHADRLALLPMESDGVLPTGGEGVAKGDTTEARHG